MLINEYGFKLKALFAERDLVHLVQMIFQGLKIGESSRLMTKSTSGPNFKTNFFSDAHISVNESLILIDNAFTLLEYFLKSLCRIISNENLITLSLTSRTSLDLQFNSLFEDTRPTKHIVST
jgi:hypothetical protein